MTKKPYRKIKPNAKQSHDEIITTPPRSPQNNKFTIDLDQDLASKKDGSPGLTPTEKRIKEIFRDEFLCSQNATESMCDVRWDCTSPDAIRQAMKRPIKKTQAVSELAQRLKVSDDELNYEEQDVKDKSLLGLCQPNIGFADAVKRETRKKSKRGVKKRSKGVLIAPDFTQQYQAWLDEIEALRKAGFNTRINILFIYFQMLFIEEEVKVTEVCEIPCEILTDDNICKKTLLDDPDLDLLLEDDTLLPTGVIKCVKTSSSDNTEDGWSDDELFDEDSFLMQATQMSENKLAELCKSNKRKRDSLGLTGKPSKDLRTVSKTDAPVNQRPNIINKSSATQIAAVNSVPKIIPKPTLYNQQNKPTVISKQAVIPAQNKPVPANSANANSFLSRNSFYSSTKSPFRKHNSFSGSPNISPVENNVGNSVKSPFRKHKSFDASKHLTSTPTGKTNPSRTSRSDFQRSLSRNGLNCDKQFNNNNLNSVINKNSMCVLPKITEEKPEPKNVPKPKSLIDNFMEENDSFLDTSISDEILRQLAEPDEVLESQATPKEPPVKEEVKADVNDNIVDDEVLQEMFDDDFSFSDINVNLENPPVQKEISNSSVQKGVSTTSTQKGVLIPPVQNRMSNSLAQKGISNISAQTGLSISSSPQKISNLLAGVSNTSAHKGNSNISAQKVVSNPTVQKKVFNQKTVSNQVQEIGTNQSVQNTFRTSADKVCDTKFVKQSVQTSTNCKKLQPNIMNKGPVSSNLLSSKTNLRVVSTYQNVNSTNQTLVKKPLTSVGVRKPLKNITPPVKPPSGGSAPSQNKFSFKKKSTIGFTKTNQPGQNTAVQNPVKNFQSTDKLPLNKSITMTQDLFNDDSFNCDDPLIESQFLAELEKVESSLKSSKS
ncbi:hypothetical protein LOTGIDRAFT_166329 [Lottia gigantea]|uniref:Uncharacterized protein n=1 Tax=Lottia gigantea TaxID=225164 RepID=V3ZYM1_LOTGI|nr:hypothetical protein LOTGIDRAFT_166329 [Lottia gigantea]ESO87740.1 hypothetical protein LOTGIDRAFT_166329 [Lottia gigantea]